MSDVDRARTFEKWAGRTTLGIAVLHVAVLTPATAKWWPAWVRGEMWGRKPGTFGGSAAAHAFWALPGSFAAPLAVVGTLTGSLVREGRPVPPSVGRVLLGWVLGCAAIAEPSGFPLGFLPVGFYLRASQLRRKGAVHAESVQR